MKPVVLFLYCISICYITLVDSAQVSITILHNNDIHSRFEEVLENSAACQKKDSQKGKCLGGMSRTIYEVKRHRKLADEGHIPPVLVLNAGDIFTGTAWYNVHKQKICVDFMNLFNPDVTSLGNHDFDDGVKKLSYYVNSTKFPIVAANLDFSKTPELQKIKPSNILEISGQKIGIIGYLTNETQKISSPGNVAFIDEVSAIRRESHKLDEQGVKIIIALGHSGFELDQIIAAECPLVDLVVGGHTNTFLYTGQPPSTETPEGPYPAIVEQKSGKKVPVVQAYAYTKYLGRLNVTFDDEGNLINFAGEPIFMSHQIPQDEETLQLLEKYRPEVDALENTVTGRTKVLLEAGLACRSGECDFGNLVTDALVAYISSISTSSYWTDYPIALINAGALRNPIDASGTNGNVTRGALLFALPYGSQVISCSLNGTDLLRTIENGVRSDGETSRGEFLQVSGVHVVYDLSRPTGSRVVSAKVRCGECSVPVYEDIDPEKTYNIIANSFMLAGGDGFTVLKENHFDKRTEDLSDFDVTAWYLQNFSPVYPEVQGRIQFANDFRIPIAARR